MSSLFPFWCLCLAGTLLAVGVPRDAGSAEALPRAATSASERLPGGGTATRSSGDIARAWYARPTDRYPHGVLGDAIEAGSLVVVTRDGTRVEHVLGDRHVFEDLAPRIADLDGDGRNEVVTIRSSLSRGAALAIYGLARGALVERAATAEIGRPNRWLSVAGIGRYGRDGGLVVAYVETPHLGGTLRYARFSGGRLSVRTILAGGVSNHRIGSTLLSMSATADVDGDGVAELALPSADRRSLVVVSDGSPAAYPAGVRIDGPIRFSSGLFVTRGEDGRRIAIKPGEAR